MRIGPFEMAEPVPEPRNTRAIALLRPWVDVGKVGTLVLRTLERHLNAQEVGRLSRPGKYFDFTRYRPRMTKVEGRTILSTPNSNIYYTHDDQTDQSYMFLHLREPHSLGEDYCESIVALLKHFNVTEYCRVGGFYDSVPHTRPLMVTGALGESQRELLRGIVSVRRNTYQGPTSIVNMVTEGLVEAKILTASLMVHIPHYVQLDEDYLAASRLLKALSALYGFPRSLANTSRGERQYQGIVRAVENNPEVEKLVQQLENDYDRLQTDQEPERQIALPPDMEKFLREMGKRLESDQGEGMG